MPTDGIENGQDSHGILLGIAQRTGVAALPAPTLKPHVHRRRSRVPVAFRRYPPIVKHSVLSTTPTAEKPALSDEQRAERLRLLAERLHSPDGLDRDTLEHIEQLTGAER
jgi:hypothetical protein